MKFCDECTRQYKEKMKKYQADYDKNVRRKKDKKYTDFYQSQMWLRFRSSVLNYFNGIDVYEYYKTGKLVPAETIHHIIELRDDFNLRLEFKNVIPLSKRNHSIIHLLYKRDKRKYQQLLVDMGKKYIEEIKDLGG
jgi:hypothetical protein